MYSLPRCFHQVTKNSHAVLSWIIESRKPEAVWCAGQFEECGPLLFESRSLTHVLRCPPMVQRVLRHTSNELGAVGEETKGQELREYNKSYVPSRFVPVDHRLKKIKNDTQSTRELQGEGYIRADFCW